MGAKATEQLRVDIAAVVRDHPLAAGHPPLVVDDLVDRVCDAAYDEIARQAEREW